MEITLFDTFTSVAFTRFAFFAIFAGSAKGSEAFAVIMCRNTLVVTAMIRCTLVVVRAIIAIGFLAG